MYVWVFCYSSQHFLNLSSSKLGAWRARGEKETEIFGNNWSMQWSVSGEGQETKHSKHCLDLDQASTQGLVCGGRHEAERAEEQWAVRDAMLCNWVVWIHECQGNKWRRKSVLLLRDGREQASETLSCPCPWSRLCLSQRCQQLTFRKELLALSFCHLAGPQGLEVCLFF